MIVGLLCSNHITYRFGKGLTPKQYRLDMGTMAVIMDEYARLVPFLVFVLACSHACADCLAKSQLSTGTKQLPKHCSDPLPTPSLPIHTKKTAMHHPPPPTQPSRPSNPEQTLPLLPASIPTRKALYALNPASRYSTGTETHTSEPLLQAMVDGRHRVGIWTTMIIHDMGRLEVGVMGIERGRAMLRIRLMGGRSRCRV